MKSLSRVVLEDILQKESLVVVDAARFKELEEAERSLGIYKKYHWWHPHTKKCSHGGTTVDACNSFHVANSRLDMPYENCTKMWYCMACGAAYCDKHVELYMKRFMRYDHTTICFDCLEQNGRIE